MHLIARAFVVGMSEQPCQPITAWSHQNNGGLTERTDPTPAGETFDTFWYSTVIFCCVKTSDRVPFLSYRQ